MEQVTENDGEMVRDDCRWSKQSLFTTRMLSKKRLTRKTKCNETCFNLNAKYLVNKYPNKGGANIYSTAEKYLIIFALFLDIVASIFILRQLD